MHVWLSRLSVIPCTERLPVQFLVRVCARVGCRFHLHSCFIREAINRCFSLTSMCVSFFLPLPSSFSKIFLKSIFKGKKRNKRKYRYVLECKKSDAHTIVLKQCAWQALTQKHTPHPNVSLRGSKQVKKSWENVKALTKKIVAHERRE